MSHKRMNQLRLSEARKILQMMNGGTVASSQFSSVLALELLEEGILVQIVNGYFKKYRIIDTEGCRIYLAQHYDIKGSLESWIEIKEREMDVSRSEQVAVTGNSKVRKVRAFRGFLVNSYIPMEVSINSEKFVIHPLSGTSLFIEDFEHFCIPEDVVVVGMENGENFQHVRGQQYLFEGMSVLFVSRYPQSKDLRRWLQMIPNRYIHFGDFDLAGIHIFQTEFYAFLGNRAEFFIPKDIEKRLKNGSRELYDEQYIKYKTMIPSDERLFSLVEMIHQYRRGYEQEGYIDI